MKFNSFAMQPGCKRRPLMSFREACERSGIEATVLAGMLSVNGAPKARLHHKSRGYRQAWFDSFEMKKWLNSIK